MVQHETFRMLGIIYGILGLIGTAFEILKCVVRLGAVHIQRQSDPFYDTTRIRKEHDLSPLISLPLSSMWFVFFVVLLIGIQQKNLILVKAHRIFLIVCYMVGLIVVALGIVVLTAFYDEKDAKVARVILVIMLVLMLATYSLTLWIVNGVIKYVEYERAMNGTVIYYPEMQKHNFENYASV